jgi:hypothetical protein
MNNNNLICTQLAGLNQNVNELIIANRAKFNQIVAVNPHYAYKLYKTVENQSLNRAFGKELLLRQMDRLLE